MDNFSNTNISQTNENTLNSQTNGMVANNVVSGLGNPGQLDNSQVNMTVGASYDLAESGKFRGGGNGGGKGLVKLIMMLIMPIGMVIGAVSLVGANNKGAANNESDGVILEVGMVNTNWKDIGNVFEPLIELPIKVQNSYENWEFLLDSGAVISSLPRDWADKMGKDIDMMKRSTFKGFGDKTSFAYQGEMTILLGEKDVNIPVVFTEASGTKSLLGRKGFFQDYSVYFNHKDKVIEIRK